MLWSWLLLQKLPLSGYAGLNSSEPNWAKMPTLPTPPGPNLRAASHHLSTFKERAEVSEGSRREHENQGEPLPPGPPEAPRDPQPPGRRASICKDNPIICQTKQEGGPHIPIRPGGNIVCVQNSSKELHPWSRWLKQDFGSLVGGGL